MHDSRSLKTDNIHSRLKLYSAYFQQEENVCIRSILCNRLHPLGQWIYSAADIGRVTACASFCAVKEETSLCVWNTDSWWHDWGPSTQCIRMIYTGIYLKPRTGKDIPSQDYKPTKVYVSLLSTSRKCFRPKTLSYVLEQDWHSVHNCLSQQLH